MSHGCKRQKGGIPPGKNGSGPAGEVCAAVFNADYFDGYLYLYPGTSFGVLPVVVLLLIVLVLGFFSSILHCGFLFKKN
jgi:hypothetical protein